MESRYVDVFVSHKMEDAAKAKALKRRIESFGLTCWIDDDDQEMKRLQTAVAVDYQALTDRIREHLRTCRCLIYAYSARSRASRWMPWELGFFDGRWGRRLIGTYDLDEGAKADPVQAELSDGEVGVPEFLQIYSEVQPATLESFLQYARSPRALSDRADVDIDRWANLVAGMMRDPVNVSIDAVQFWISYQQAFWGRALGMPGPDLSQPLLALTEMARAAMAPFGPMMQSVSPAIVDWMVERQAVASDVAQGASRGQAPGLGGFAEVVGGAMPVPGVVDHFVRLIHDANADALKASR